MSSYRCDECGALRPLFDGTAGNDLSVEFGVPLLARVPFTPGAGPANCDTPGLIDTFLGCIR